MKKLLVWLKSEMSSLQARTATISFLGVVCAIILAIFVYSANVSRLGASFTDANNPDVYSKSFYSLVQSRHDSVRGIVINNCKAVKITVIVANDSIVMYSSDSSVMHEIKGKVLGVDKTKHVLFVMLKNSEIMGVGKYSLVDFPSNEQEILVLKYGLYGKINILSQSKDCEKVLKRLTK